MDFEAAWPLLRLNSGHCIYADTVAIYLGVTYRVTGVLWILAGSLRGSENRVGSISFSSLCHIFTLPALFGAVEMNSGVDMNDTLDTTRRNQALL